MFWELPFRRKCLITIAKGQEIVTGMRQHIEEVEEIHNNHPKKYVREYHLHCVFPSCTGWQMHCLEPSALLSLTFFTLVCYISTVPLLRVP